MKNIIEDGVYEIAIHDSDLVLDVEFGSNQDGTQIIAYERSGALWQCFRITNLKDDVYTIIDLHSYKAVSVNMNDYDDGFRVQILPYDVNKDIMKWRFIEVEDDFYKIENVDCGFVLDLSNEYWDNETPICAYEYHGGNNQKFKLNKKEISDVNIPQHKEEDAFDNIMNLLKPTPAPAAPVKPPAMPSLFSSPHVSFGEQPADPTAEALNHMEAALQVMKKQLDDMKKQQENAKYKEKTTESGYSTEEVDALKEDFNARYDEAISTMDSLVYGDNPKIKAVASIVYTSKFSRISPKSKGAKTFICTSLDDIDEDEMVSALEPFANPRRIKLLKVLMERTLPANEISQATGLVGGQLYHHLQNLESAKLIEKTGDRYKATVKAHIILCSFSAAMTTGGIIIADEGSSDREIPEIEMPIEELELSIRSLNSLKRNGIDTVEDLVSRTEDDIIKIRNLSKLSFEEITKKLNSLGLTFGKVYK